MNKTNIDVVDAPQTVLGEAPMWSVGEQALYWVDVVGRCIFRLQHATGQIDVCSLPYAPSMAIPRSTGGLLLITKKGMALLNFELGELTSLPVPLIDFSKEVFNDAKCDSAGRLWVGTRDIEVKEPHGGLFRLDSDFSMHRCGSGFTVSNGIAWAPNGRTMYHIDTHPGRIDAYDFDVAHGTISERRIFRDYHSVGASALPDGCTVDSEGGLWVAEVGDWHIRRYAPDGALDREIRVPLQKPTSLMFGGPNLNTLYVTSMRFGLTEEQLAGQPLAGSLLQLDVGVRGLPETDFAG
ncbi:SMP-30/gluconolactonase/LRE family protein [Alcaligenaceae bacterium]|nr:SMP-30/gluconolactonase/LRE family protein [Alcaligenaceae bacterium]